MMEVVVKRRVSRDLGCDSGYYKRKDIKGSKI